jgi:hypothetical protein
MDSPGSAIAEIGNCIVRTVETASVDAQCRQDANDGVEAQETKIGREEEPLVSTGHRDR